MTKYCIKTHRPGATYNKPNFFILNKGLISGKPSIAPCSNRFAFEAASEEELDK